MAIAVTKVAATRTAAGARASSISCSPATTRPAARRSGPRPRASGCGVLAGHRPRRCRDQLRRRDRHPDRLQLRDRQVRVLRGLRRRHRPVGEDERGGVPDGLQVPRHGDRELAVSLLLPESYLERELRSVALEEAEHIMRGALLLGAAAARHRPPPVPAPVPPVRVRRGPVPRDVAHPPGRRQRPVHRVGDQHERPRRPRPVPGDGPGHPRRAPPRRHVERGSLHDQYTVRRRREESEERAKANHREARRDDLAVNVKAMINPGVSLAARGARAKARKK
jgi:hypothetical protein